MSQTGRPVNPEVLYLGKYSIRKPAGRMENRWGLSWNVVACFAKTSFMRVSGGVAGTHEEPYRQKKGYCL
jgi:hypothetical protein